MRLLTIAWTLVAVTWYCCDGAYIPYPSAMVRNADWYDSEIQDVELLDKNYLDPMEKRNSLGPMQGESPRSRPTLSIVNSLDVLRQKLMYEVARRQVNENQKVLLKNHEMLKNLGKRSPMHYFGVP